MSLRENLTQAKRNKNDEFYTQLKDIENELKHYKQHFKDKIVLCNCDDPTWSAFWKYFHLNFAELGLKKLISTHYDREEATYKMEYSGGDDNDIEVGVKIPLKGNGDFRNQECLDLIDEADIVVTNPPFSLFREYVAVLMEYNKKFLIIGNINALTYKETFNYIKEDKMWLGYNTTRYFLQPDGSLFETARTFWYTNLDIEKRHEDIILYKKYNKEEYPTYDNYNAINIDKTNEIPMDYDGVMGVPITFLDRYNPEQFEIVGLGIVGSCEFTNNRKMEILKKGVPTGKFTYNAKGTLYRKHNPKTDKKHPAFMDVETKELYQSIYARILIKKKGVSE